MLGKLRTLARGQTIRHALRDKTMRALDEVLLPHHREQQRRIDELAVQVSSLQASLDDQANRVLDRVGESEVRSRRDIIYAGDQEAALQSNRFARQQMVGARHFGDPLDTLRYGLSLAPTGGMALEFGVATGGTLRVIAAARHDDQVYGFDSFDGLPEAWLAGMPAGAFAKDERPEVAGAQLVVGLFADTLPTFLDKHQDMVDFVHVDSDLYSSAKTVLEQVGPRLQPGSVLVFDEFFNYPGWEEHEFRAWREYVEAADVAFSYVAYTYDDSQVVVRITDTAGRDVSH